MTQDTGGSYRPTGMTANRHVIAHIHPIGLGSSIFLLSVALILLLDSLINKGWSDPATFATENHRKLLLILDFPFAGQAITLGTASLLALLLFQFALLAFRRFEDVVFEDGRLFYVSRPWLGKTPRAAVAAVRWVEPQHETRLNSGTKNIEVLHVARTRGGRSLRTVVLRPWFYREGPGQIAANFEACGFHFKTPTTPRDLPIWERHGVE